MKSARRLKHRAAFILRFVAAAVMADQGQFANDIAAELYGADESIKAFSNRKTLENLVARPGLQPTAPLEARTLKLHSVEIFL